MGWMVLLAILFLILVYISKLMVLQMDFVKGLAIQPSEFSKLAVIIMLSSFASAPDRDLDTRKLFYKLANHFISIDFNYFRA